MSVLPAILTLLTGVAGWFYLFHSRAAHGLADYEQATLNRRRVRLRRLGGGVMLLLATALTFGFYAADEARPKLFVAVWVAVMLLLAAVIVLALVDVRLTWRLRRRSLRSAAARPAGPAGTPPPPSPERTRR